MSNWLTVYHRLPYLMKILAVSLHGWRLQTLRYNGKTDTLVAQSQERESWSIEKWDSWQQ